LNRAILQRDSRASSNFALPIRYFGDSGMIKRDIAENAFNPSENN